LLWTPALGAEASGWAGAPPAFTGAAAKVGACGASGNGALTVGVETEGWMVGAGALGAEGTVVLVAVGAPDGVVGVADWPGRSGVLTVGTVGTVGRAGATGTCSAIAVDPPIASVASTANPFVAAIVRIFPRI
jgi:hypothetical protein